ncbi:MAG TPA: cytochrome c biogenesis heme-transporting ATPase CcmA [Steroidobacteraceae bacterium]|jgi:heme exporter protein A|nr:cytochrome c biogenesis heme-transporting ATPase CcmA [Steroidobacteraceae bacterium]
MVGSTIRAENLHLWRSERHVLKGVDLTVRGGELLQLTGVNGAGKTTLLRALCGLNHLEEGRVFWNDQDVREDRDGFHAALVYLGHEPPLKPDLSGHENLRFWTGMRRRVSHAAIHEALVRTGAGEFATRAVRTLSAGQRRRVALAALILAAVPLWLLDEPTTNLDSGGQELVAALLHAHLAAGGLAIAAVHHRLAIEPARVRELNLSA